MDAQFKNSSASLLEFERLSREDKGTLELAISEVKFKLSKAQDENEEHKRKIENSTHLFQDTFKENEKIVREFEDFKRQQLAFIGQRENDVNSLKTNTFYAENKIKESIETIRGLERRINDGDKLYSELRERNVAENKRNLDKISEIKLKVESMSSTLAHTHEKLVGKQR